MPIMRACIRMYLHMYEYRSCSNASRSLVACLPNAGDKPVSLGVREREKEREGGRGGKEARRRRSSGAHQGNAAGIIP